MKARALCKPDFRVEVAANIFIHSNEAEEIVLEPRIHSSGKETRAHTWRRGAHQKTLDLIVVGEVELCIHACAAVVPSPSGGGSALPIDEHCTHGRAFKNVALNAADRVLLARDAKARLRVAEASRLNL